MTDATIIKFRAVLSIYDQNNLPNMVAFKGIVFDTVEDAQVGIEKLAKEMLNDLISAKVFNKGYDPFGYFIEDYNETCIFIRHNKFIFDDNLGCPSKSFMYNIHIVPVVCIFNGKTNKISYKTMELNQFMDNWYVHSINGSIIGCIHANESLNEILAQADKIYDELDSDYQIPAPKLKNN